ncbi:MAG: tetrathionate reductase family octaheme c-type cytochrome [Anaerolineales bacterium]|nr:tetrathionate reductase family octaheme c-type cytochrome [Anaerolineales bacterium]
MKNITTRKKRGLATGGIILGITLIIFGLSEQTITQASPAAYNQSNTILQQPGSTETAPEPSKSDVEVNHSEFEILQQDFASGPEVTKACLSCHINAAAEIQGTTHWTWEYEHPETGQILGKQNVINSFCIALDSNEPRCTSCHVGYGWTDDTFDFSEEESVDCLVCHDTTGTYKKFPTAAGHPAYEPLEFPSGSGTIWQPPDLSYVAQNVGDTSRHTCGACHFYGGGADAVKHGDLDSSLLNPDFALDVHLDADGLNFSCTTCHNTDGHDLEGSRYSMNSTDEETCETCHTAEPHNYEILNQHLERIACQTCHIPEYARGGIATKTWWDWSKAGILDEDGNSQIIKDDEGHTIYDSRKGEFEYGENVVPEYIWFNGEVDYTLLADTVDPANILTINPPGGSRDDEASRIWPMKVFRGIQPYDVDNNTLVIPHLFGSDSAAYWKSFEWDAAIEAGMTYAGAPYSGSYDFIETQMYWPITHMVAPAEEALTCLNCHTGEDSRLDFSALGYTEGQAQALSHFPPTANLGMVIISSSESDQCTECHEEQVHYWTDSKHGQNDVGCVACHKLESEGTHPDTAYSVSLEADLCGGCHLEDYHDWSNSQHTDSENGRFSIACISCHESHALIQLVPRDGTTSCDACHKNKADDVVHSTHTAKGVTCVDCHKVTQQNTGHTFEIQSDSCTRCHGRDIHSANNLLLVSPAQGAALTVPEPTEAPVKEEAVGAYVNISTWGYVLIGIMIGLLVYWLIAGKEPGTSAERVNAEEETKES